MADCTGFPKKEDLLIAKQAIDHITHVATSLDSSGIVATDVTDTVGLLTVTNKTLLGLEELYTDAIQAGGLIPLDSFQAGAPNGVLTLPNQALRDTTTGEYYVWHGSFPKPVPAGSTPASTGGIGTGKWLSVGDAVLRTQLASPSTGNGANLITVLKSGTGAVAKTQQQVDEYVIDARDFVNNITSSTDWTAAIRAAIAKAAAYSSRGAKVVLPSGLLNISDTITIPDLVHLSGQGRYQTFLRCTADGTVVDPVVNMSGSNAQLSGLGVTYSVFQSVNGTGVRSTGSNNRLVDFNISACFNGLQVYTGSGQLLSNFTVTDCKSVGFQIGESPTSFINDVFAKDFFVLSNDHTNFVLGAVRSVGRVESLVLKDCDLIGSVRSFVTDPGSTAGTRFSTFNSMYMDGHENPCDIVGLNHSSFTDCWISGRGSSGAYFTNCFSLDFKGLRVYNNNRTGIIFNGCHHFSITESDLSFNNTDGIGNPQSYDDVQLIACNDFIISNNTGYEAGGTRYAVLINTGCYGYSLKDNKFTSRATSIFSEPTSGITPAFVDGNRGYLTKNYGSTSLPASSLSVVVTHGLAITPILAQIRIQQNGSTVTPLYVSAVTSTTFTVSTASTNTAGSAFSWNIDCTYR